MVDLMSAHATGLKLDYTRYYGSRAHKGGNVLKAFERPVPDEGDYEEDGEDHLNEREHLPAHRGIRATVLGDGDVVATRASRGGTD